MAAKRVIIIGAGVAGIAAAAAITERGFHTILLERRKLPGGRATSIAGPDADSLVDNCQHVLLGCCTNLLDLYQRLGVADQIQFFDTIHFADETGRRSSLYASALPSPLHLSWSMLRFGLLGIVEKAQIGRAMLAMKLLGRAGREPLDHMTFQHWLHDHGQSARTIERFWKVILISALNADVAHISAKYGMQVFQDAFLGHRRGYRMAIPTVSLAALYARPLASEVHLGRRATGLLHRDGRIVGVMTAGGSDENTEVAMEADYVVVAVAPDAARRLLGETLLGADPQLSGLDRLDFSPIIGAHLWYDRPVMDLPHLALIGTQLQWLFRKDAGGRHIHGVISAADRLASLDSDALAALLDGEVRQLLPLARDATLVRSLIIKEKRATFCPSPGVDAIRPAQLTTIPGLILAGDYTRTGWPATMEGAARSGYLASEAILRLEHRPQRVVCPDLL